MPILELFGLIFEWHDPKAELVFNNRGISLDEVASVFLDSNAIESEDIGDYDEVRKILIGMSNQARLLGIVFTERNDTFRIITAYFPTNHQERSYTNAPKY